MCFSNLTSLDHPKTQNQKNKFHHKNNRQMKRIELLFIGFILSISCNAFSQERKDETRQTVDFMVESKSGILLIIGGIYSVVISFSLK
jgi:hypothetical protein